MDDIRIWKLVRSGDGSVAKEILIPKRAGVHLEGQQGNTLLNGIDLHADIRPDLLRKIRAKLREDIAILDERLGREVPEWPAEIVVRVNGVDLMTMVSPSIHLEIINNVRLAISAVFPNFNPHRESPWKMLMRWLRIPRS